MRSARPTIEPGLRPTDQLVAAERDDVGAGGQALARRRLVGQPEALGRQERPAAQVVDDDGAVAMGELARARSGSGASTKPSWTKFEGWTRRTRRAEPSASGASKSATRVRFVVPTSISRAPARRTISGMRTPAADLDQLAARDGDPAAPPGQSDGQRHRGGVVVRDERVLGAGQGDEVLLGEAEARAAPAGGAVELQEERLGGGGAARPRSRPPATGARPRFVWMITPVALMTAVAPPST